MQAKQASNFVEIPIDDGTVPNWETRLSNPKLFNAFVGEMGKVYCSPWLHKINVGFEMTGVRAIHQTYFGAGSYIVVTANYVLRVDNSGHVSIISSIKNTGLPVQIAENLQDQVGITDCRNFYVIDQNAESFTVMGEAQGFTYKTPISIVVVNSIAVVLDLDTSSWALSDPNQMLTFPALDFVAQISSSLTKASSLETLDDNLYIFGTTGIERWVPNSGNNPYLFPFAKDNNFRVDFGAISINSTQRAFGMIYFLSSKYIPMVITGRGTESIPLGGEGMAKVLASYPDVMRAECSFYSFKDNFFYHMYFPESGISWVYCEGSKKWANGDDAIISCVPREGIVATPLGLFSLTDDESDSVSKLRMWQSRRMKNYKGTETNRELLSSVDTQIIQGFVQSSTVEPQHISLNISLDSESWLNSVPSQIGNTGDRNALTIWRMNIAAKEYTLNLQYQGTLNFTIDKVTVVLK